MVVFALVCQTLLESLLLKRDPVEGCRSVLREYFPAAEYKSLWCMDKGKRSRGGKVSASSNHTAQG